MRIICNEFWPNVSFWCDGGGGGGSGGVVVVVGGGGGVGA